MEQQRRNSNSKMSSSKLRNLKEFLRSSRRSLLPSSQAHSHSPGLTGTDNDFVYHPNNHHEQDNSSGSRGQEQSSSNNGRRKSSINSRSLLNLMGVSSSSSNNRSPARSSNPGHQLTLTAFDDQDEPYDGYPPSHSSMNKSKSMYGLSPSASEFDYDEDETVLQNKDNSKEKTPKNMAIKLFNNIRSKFRKRKDSRNNKTFDTSKSGSFHSPRSSIGSEKCSQNRALKSSRSVDNVLESLLGSRPLPNIGDAVIRVSPRFPSPDQNPDDEIDNVFEEQERDDNRLHRNNPLENAGVTSNSSQNQRNYQNLNVTAMSPVPVPVPYYTGKSQKCLTKELEDLLHFGWYWGGLSKDEAEAKLNGQPDGSFLVRDSSSDHFILSLSFISAGYCLHTRIAYLHGLFCFDSSEDECFHTVAELIGHCVANSESGVFCYSRKVREDIPQFPVRLTKPISRFTEVKSLLYLSRFVIRQSIRMDRISQLELPQSLIEYVSEKKYIY